MLRHCLGIVGILVTASAANAQASANWSGFYVGANGFGSRDRIAADATLLVNQVSGLFVTGRGVVIVPGTTRPFAAAQTRTNWGGGGQLGFQWQAGNVVFGAEADFDPFRRNASVSQTQQLPQTALTPTTTIFSQRDIRIDQEWTARARLGIAFATTLVYATGGYVDARARMTSIDSFTDPGGPAAPCTPACQANLGPDGPVVTTGSARSHMSGWTGGGGVERQLGAHFSLGLEYRHTDLGARTFLPTNSTTVNTGPETHGDNGLGAGVGNVNNGPTHVALRSDAVSLRLNFRF